MMYRVSFILKRGRLMVSYTYTDAARAYTDAAELLRGGKCDVVRVTEVPAYAWSPLTPYHFKQRARKIGGEWMVSLTKQRLK